MHRICWLVVAAVALLLIQSAEAAGRHRYTMLVDIDGSSIEGTPLAWSKQSVFLLARDGRLWEFPPSRATNFRKISSSFVSFSAAEVRAALERELDGRLEVTGTGHYLVAHPLGKGPFWANRFEELYRSCVNYFNRRGLRVRDPEFPLVAIVWPRREDFVHYAASQGSNVRGDILGFYSPVSNRVTLYDQGGSGAGGSAWRQNEATIIHEATHQMAFNTGVHNRFTTTPKWIAEGLGTMFEAPGVWNWRAYPRRDARINHDRLMQFQQWRKTGRKSGAFVQLLGSDRLFDSNPAAAYAESWAWVFFLTEVYPRKFGEYVQRTANRPDFVDYPMTRRIADFTAVFGNDMRMLESHFLRFIDGLR